jgi:hypothetical protein
MIPTTGWRIAAWGLVYAGVVAFFVIGALSHSRAAYEAGDKSAWAWMGFFPFIFPLFCIQAAYYLMPVLLVVEVIFFGLWYWGIVR